MPPTRLKPPITRFPLLALFVLVAALLLPAAGFAQYSKNVLVLNSYAPGYKWTDDIVTGISEAVQKGGTPVSLHQMFMDTKRASSPEYFRLLYETYRYQFQGSSFDAIIATDNDAFDFLLLYRDRLFPGTPVVFCGVNDFRPSQLHGARLFTGVNEAPDIRATLDLALKLHPKTRQIVVINDTTVTGRAVHEDIRKALPFYRGRVNFVLLEDVTMEELLARVRKLPPDSLVFYTFFLRDKEGRVFSFEESIRLIAKLSPVPVYGAWDFNLGYGMVGGMLTSGYNQGKTAGEMTLRVLQGEKADRIPVVMNSPNRFAFDYRQLRRFGISVSQLPRDSVVINRPLDFYRVHKALIWVAVGALAALMLIILLLLLLMALRRRSAEALARLTGELERRVEERTRELEESRSALERQNRELQETYHGLQAETEERIRVMEELRVKEQLLIHQSRMAAMGEMLGNIAHQWRQPLNVLGLKIQELGLSYKHGQFSKELLDANISNAMSILLHLSKTIDDFRTFLTPDKQKILFSVNEVIEKTVSLIEDNFRRQGIDLEICVENDPQIDGYPNEFSQVLLNILMNAKDACQEREIAAPRITLRCWAEDGRAELVIADNAGGIEEGILDRIFDPYFTTKPLGKGTGVGLFMSKTIIEKHMSGSLTVRNIEGGVEFRITI